MVVKKSKEIAKLGEIAFLGGVILAAIVGLVPSAVAGYNTTIALVLVVLGILVGLINITAKETHEFLLATVALLIAGTAGLQIIPVVGTFVQAVLSNVVSFVAPAAVIVALKAVYELA